MPEYGYICAHCGKEGFSTIPVLTPNFYHTPCATVLGIAPLGYVRAPGTQEIEPMQITDDPSPKPFYKSFTLAVVPVLAVAVGGKWGGYISQNTELILDIAAAVIAVVGRWRAGGVHIPVIGSKEK